MEKIAFVFPGQGSQYVGMGRDLYETYPEAKALFDEADGILGFPLARLCFEGPKEELDDTINTQPALLTVSVALLQITSTELSTGLELDQLNPASVAGHSMGEYTALVAAEALDFADGLHLVRERGRLMKEAGELNPGAMAAIIGLDAGTLEDICQEARIQFPVSSVQIANYNSPGQIVISGHKEALGRTMELAREQGARRVIPLAVSIASHSPLMQPAAESFASIVAQVDFHQPRVPVVANVTAAPITTVAEIKEELVEQLTSTVRWVESVQYMIAQGVTTFVEIGPKNVLTGLIKRIDESMRTVNVEDVASTEAFVEMMIHLT
ncbi:MAG: ACP S-malonyltransferase [Anaerolineae bacterium]